MAKVLKPKIRQIERVSLTPAQAKTLLHIARNDVIGPAVGLAGLAGLRTSEIQGLTWKAIDFEKGLIHVRQAYSERLV